MRGSALRTLAALQAELDRCPFHEVLGLRAVRVDEEAAVIELPFRAELGIEAGGNLFHGGVVASMADVAAHATLALSVGGVVPTTDLRVDFLRRAGAPRLVAAARILHLGSALGRADVEIRDDAGQLVACARGSFSTARGARGEVRPGRGR